MRKMSARSIVFVLWIAGLCAAAQFAKIGLFMPELGALYVGAGSALGFLLSSISFVGAVFGLLAGGVAQRVGLRRLLVGGLLLGCVVSMVQSLGLPLELLMLSRVVEGVSHLAIVVSAPTLVALNSTDKYRPTAMTIWGTFFGVSFALTALLGLPFVAANGIHSLFLVHGLFMGLISFVVAVVVPAQSVSPLTSDIDKLCFSPRAIVLQHVRIWRSPSMSAPAIGWLFYTITFVALLAVLPGMMRPEERAFTSTFLPIASIISSMTIGVILLKRYPAVNVICIGFSIAIVFAIALPVFQPGPLLCIALFAALGLVQGASFASVPELNKSANEQALANGALAQAGNFGNACGTPLLLLLLSVGGLGTMTTLVVGCYFIAIISHGLLARKRQGRQQ